MGYRVYQDTVRVDRLYLPSDIRNQIAVLDILRPNDVVGPGLCEEVGFGAGVQKLGVVDVDTEVRRVRPEVRGRLLAVYEQHCFVRIDAGSEKLRAEERLARPRRTDDEVQSAVDEPAVEERVETGNAARTLPESADRRIHTLGLRLDNINTTSRFPGDENVGGRGCANCRWLLATAVPCGCRRIAPPACRSSEASVGRLLGFNTSTCATSRQHR